MVKKKITRKSNRTLNLFADGGTVSTPSTSPTNGGSNGSNFAQYVPVIGSTVGSALSQIPNVNRSNTAIEEAVYGNSQQDPVQRFLGDITGSSTKDVVNSFNQRDILSASNNEDLISLWNSLEFQDTMKTEKGLIGKTLLGTALGAPWLDYQNGQVKFSSDNLLASAQGASKGSSFGPFGALIGGIAGGVLNLGSRLGRNRRIRKINKAIERRNSYLQSSFSNAAANVDKQNDFGTIASYAAYGGPLNIFGSGAIDYELAKEDLNNKRLNAMSKYKMTSLPSSFEMEGNNIFADGGSINIKPSKKGTFTAAAKKHGKSVQEFASQVLDNKENYSPAMIKKAVFAKNAAGWKHGDGGNLYISTSDTFQHGGIFSNGITTIDNGGTHEQNPMEGVPMGIAPDGTPNLVEQGEVKFNNYVFSNRLFATGGLLAANNLPASYANHSFADIAEKLSKESSERPNDPISKRGLLSSMAKLQQAQEQLRTEIQTRKYAKGGHLFATGGPYGTDPSLPNIYDDYLVVPTGTKVDNPFAFENISYQTPVNTPIVNNTAFELAPAIVTAEKVNKTTSKTTSKTGDIKKNKNAKLNNNTNEDVDLSWLRYAPVVGAGLGVLSDTFGITNRPDYTNANLVGSIADTITDVDFNPIGNYLTYRPFDRNYYLNKLNAEAGATRRAIVNQSGGNRATAMAGLLAADYNALGKMGDLARQAEEYNMAQRERVEAFNRGTNQFNSELALKAAEMRQRNNDLRLRARTTQAQLRDQADMRASSARAANLTNLFDSLGDIGREEFSRNIIQSNPSLYYSIDSKGNISYKNGYDELSEAEKKFVRSAATKEKNKKACGGYLTIRKRR